MKFGLRLIQFLGSPRELVDLAVLAEQSGFDSVWFPHDTFMYNTMPLTTAVAEATTSIEVGAVGINPYHCNPCEIATYVGTLDELSRGRAILGLGFHTESFVNWTGIDTEGYVEHTREATELVRALLRGDVVDYQGEHFDWNDQCYLRFRPFRESVPIYVCAFGEDYLKLSGEIGDGSLPMITPPSSAAAMVSSIHEGARSADRDLDDYVVSGCGWLSISDSRTAAADIMRNMIAYFGPHLEEHALKNIGVASADMQPLRELVEQKRYDEAHGAVSDEMLKLGMVGIPQDIVRHVEELAAAGITEIGFGGPLGPDAKAAIKLMGEKVIPYFR